MPVEITTHAAPRPVRLGRKVRKHMIAEATMDATAIAEDHRLPEGIDALSSLHAKVGEQLCFAREIAAGEVSGWDSVRMVQIIIKREGEEIRDDLASEVLRSADSETSKKGRMEQNIRRLVKRGQRLSKASRECRRYMDELREFERDQDAAERLGLSTEAVA
jgi:hypothetical protein